MRAVILLAAIALVTLSCGRSTTSLPAASSSASVAFSCSLPVISWGWVTNGSVSSISSENGFVSLPSGTIKADPTGNGGSYDWTYKRWVPVLSSQMLADGSAYTYEVELQDRPGYQIHVVQVASGADKMIDDMPYDNAYSILSLQPEGIYLVPIIHRSGLPAGLWLLSSRTAKLAAVPGAADESWQVIAGGAAWGGPAGGNRLDRLDLSTGVVTTWFQATVAEQIGIGYGYGPRVVGFDQALHPLVEFYPPIPTTASPARTTPAPEVWLVTGPGQATRLTGMPLHDDRFLEMGVTDSHGTWLAGADGIYLHTDSGFTRVVPMRPIPWDNYTIAGGCA